jgi:hypothetical protein
VAANPCGSYPGLALCGEGRRIVKTTGDGILVEFASVDMPHLKLAQRVLAQAKAAGLA